MLGFYLEPVLTAKPLGNAAFSKKMWMRVNALHMLQTLYL